MRQRRYVSYIPLFLFDPSFKYTFILFCFLDIYIPSSALFIDSFRLILFSVFFPSCLSSSEHFFWKATTIKETEKSHLGCKPPPPSPFVSLIVVCLPKQYYKSNSRPVNRLQDWLSSTLSHRGCHIINTDLYCSLEANIHKCQYAGSLKPVKIHGAIWANFMNSTKRLAVERKQAK